VIPEDKPASLAARITSVLIVSIEASEVKSTAISLSIGRGLTRLTPLTAPSLFLNVGAQATQSAEATLNFTDLSPEFKASA